MRNDKHLAIELRRRGASYNKICEELDIPKSTMHYWFRNLRWSQKVKKELTEKAQRLAQKQMKVVALANKKRWAKWRRQHREEAKKEFSTIKSNLLFVAGIMLYWGEGDNKPRGEVRLANIDSRMIKIFFKFLHKICRVPTEKIYLRLILYPDLQDEKCKKYWSKKTGVPLTQFTKSQIIYGKHPTKRLENGICIIGVRASGGLKEKIITWKDLLSQIMTK